MVILNKIKEIMSLHMHIQSLEYMQKLQNFGQQLFVNFLNMKPYLNKLLKIKDSIKRTSNLFELIFCNNLIATINICKFMNNYSINIKKFGTRVIKYFNSKILNLRHGNMKQLFFFPIIQEEFKWTKLALKFKN